MSNSQMAAATSKTNQDEEHPIPYFNQGPNISFTHLSVLDLLQDEELQQGIVTFSERIDDLFSGGGIPLAKITELVGKPGTGKTQLCLQLAVSVQIPECFGGAGGECLYIDTEQSFFLQRFERIARNAIEHCEEICDDSTEQKTALKNYNLDSILTGLHYFKCTDALLLIALVNNLSQILRERNRVKLIVIDSLAFPMRVGYEDYSLRTRILSGLAQNLIEIAVKWKLAVLVTNHMTTKFSTDRTTSHLMPSLGDNWSYVCSTRLLLRNDDGRRTATVLKSALGCGESVDFRITEEGIRDVLPDQDTEVNEELPLSEQAVTTVVNRNSYLENDGYSVGRRAPANARHSSQEKEREIGVASPPLKKQRIENATF